MFEVDNPIKQIHLGPKSTRLDNNLAFRKIVNHIITKVPKHLENLPNLNSLKTYYGTESNFEENDIDSVMFGLESSDDEDERLDSDENKIINIVKEENDGPLEIDLDDEKSEEIKIVDSNSEVNCCS